MNYIRVSVLQDLLKDFLDKKEKGELMVQKSTNLLQTILTDVTTYTGTRAYLYNISNHLFIM